MHRTDSIVVAYKGTLIGWFTPTNWAHVNYESELNFKDCASAVIDNVNNKLVKFRDASLKELLNDYYRAINP